MVSGPHIAAQGTRGRQVGGIMSHKHNSDHGITLSEATQSDRRGILKAPTVHFPDTLDPPIFASRAATSSSLSPLPPPPLPSDQPNSFYNDMPWEQNFLPPPPPPPPAAHHAAGPPSLFRPEIEANKYLSEAAHKLYTSFFDELAEFVRQQGAVARKRLAVQERRQQLRRLRDHVRDCDVALIQHFRSYLMSNSKIEEESVLKVHETAEVARDQLGPVEAEYEPLEVDLGAEEHKLRERYNRLETRFEHFFRLQLDAEYPQDESHKIQYDSSTEPSISTNAVQKDTTKVHSKHSYNATLGDQVDIGQFPLQSEVMPSDIIRDSAGLAKDQQTNPSEAFDISAWNQSRSVAMGKIQDLSQIETTSTHGYQNWVITSNESYSVQQVDSDDDLRGVGFLSNFGTPPILADADDILADIPLLNQEESLLLLDFDNESRELLSDYLVNFDNTRNRVNRWLLHKLRISHGEVTRLGRDIVNIAPELSAWASLVLSEWGHDDLGSDQSYRVGSIEDSECTGVRTSRCTGHETHQVLSEPEDPLLHFASARVSTVYENLGTTSKQVVPATTKADAGSEELGALTEEIAIKETRSFTLPLVESLIGLRNQTFRSSKQKKLPNFVIIPHQGQSFDGTKTSSEASAPRSSAYSMDFSSQPHGHGDFRAKGYSTSRYGVNNPLPSVTGDGLEQSFSVRRSSYFQAGTVLSVLFTESAGSTTPITHPGITQVRFNELVITQIRRFIVVKRKKEFCYAVPILTYSGQGTMKRGVNPHEHAIVYSYGTKPELLHGETTLSKRDICAVMNTEVPPLTVASRIRFGIHYPIHYNLKVKDLGYVHPDWMHTFMGYWKMELEIDATEAETHDVK